MNGSYGKAGRCGEEKNLLPPLGIKSDSSTIQPTASCYTGSFNNKAVNEISGNISISLLSHTELTVLLSQLHKFLQKCDRFPTKTEILDLTESTLTHQAQ
jgi:hypothetical protein